MSQSNTRFDFHWEEAFGDPEGDPQDQYGKAQNYEVLKARHIRWLRMTPICTGCGFANIGRNPNGRCYECEKEAGTLPIYALHLQRYGVVR